MGFFTKRERAELNKLAEVEGEIRDFVRQREDPGAEGQRVATKLAVLIERVAGQSIEEIDSATAGLQALRGELLVQGERVQREVVEYATRSRSAMQSTKTISEKLAQWRNETGAVATEPKSLISPVPPSERGLRA
jgi:hypothetical protein